MSRELTGGSDRLREIVMLAAEGSGVSNVGLYLRQPGRDVLDLAAVSGADERARPEPSLRTARPLVARALASDEPVVSSVEGKQLGDLVMVRVVGWTGEAIGLLTFEIASDMDEGTVASRLDRIEAVAAIVEHAVAAMARVDELARVNSSLRARAEVDRALAAVVQRGGGLSAVVRECAALTGKHVALFDHEDRQLTSAHAAAGPTVRLPGIREILAARGPVSTGDSTAFVIPAAPDGLSRRKIVAPISLGDEGFGWLVIDEHPSGFRALDRFIAERAAVHLGAEFAVQRRVARVAWNAKTSLARQMIRGTQAPHDLMASADYLGIDAGARRVLAYVLDPTGTRSDESLDQQLAAAVERLLGVEVLATRGSEGVVLLVEAPEDRGAVAMVTEVKEALAVATTSLTSGDAIVGVSTVCEPSALSRAYREAREVAHCIDRFAARSAQRVLAVDDLGPARLFLANSDTSAIRGYVQDVLGPLLTGDPAMTDLLTTLQCYFDASRSVRASAAQLGVHENTIRLRLARVASATGLDVAGDANDQLSVQTALLVLRLQGHATMLQLGVQGGTTAPEPPQHPDPTEVRPRLRARIETARKTA